MHGLVYLFMPDINGGLERDYLRRGTGVVLDGGVQGIGLSGLTGREIRRILPRLMRTQAPTNT